jgi:hypothetical protein
MFLSIWIIFRELLNNCTAYIKTHTILNTLKIVHEMSADIIKIIAAVQNWSMRCEGCSIIDFYNGSYQEDVKFMFW